jgi:small-conductance mechanosensitive channel
MRQLHLTVTVPLGSDVGTALAAATDVMTRNEHVRKDPAPVVGIAQLTDTGLRIDVNPWVHVPPVGPAEGELYRSLTEGLRLGLGPGRRSPGQRRAGRALSAD